MLHSTCTHRCWVDSRLLVVGSQTDNLTPSPSFCHNLCYRCPNGSCMAILIYNSIAFQWYKECFKARCFNPYKDSEVSRVPKDGLPSPHFGSVNVIFTLFQKWGCDTIVVACEESSYEAFVALNVGFHTPKNFGMLMFLSPRTIYRIIQH
jgi:hypothetical protein